LVLYIVRVPGSRGKPYPYTTNTSPITNNVLTAPTRLDIFLTTLKPRAQTVTAEDVQSSLYYLHVSSSTDSDFLSAYNSEKQLDEQNEQSERAKPDFVHRKPLPSKPELELGDRPAPPPKVYPHYQPPVPGDGGGSQVKRKAVRGEHIRFSSEEGRDSSISRKPLLGPRPLHTRFGSGDAGVGGNDTTSENFEENGRPRRWTAMPAATSVDRLTRSEEVNRPSSGRGSWGGLGAPELDRQNGLGYEPPALPRRPLANSDIYPETSYGIREVPPPPLPPRPIPSAIDDSDVQNFHITIIRRDPASGNQWNIGTISNALPNNDPSFPHDPSSVTVEITTPGYRKFAKTDSFPPIPSLNALFNNRNGSASSLPLSFKTTDQTVSNPSTPTNSNPSFHRTIALTQPPSPTRPFHRRQNTSDTSAESQYPSLSPPKRSKPLTSSKAHYSFLSPWNGTCTFSTGLNGRSLKCKHLLTPTLAGSDASPAVTVCEVRFNLPLTSNHSNTNHYNNAARPRIGHHFKHASLSSISSTQNREDSSDSDGRMDLSLGREKAGGGRKGKGAKIGKLVIEDEGLKMVDLVVAGAMSVFWVYSRGGGGRREG
jgi:hypothetical protein